MRQRNIKDLDKKIEENSRTLVEDPRAVKGHWHEAFGNSNPIYLEIGCGKGAFITAHAITEPSKNFIACEGQTSVVLRALEKAEENGLTNLRVFIDFVNDLADYFEEGELAGIYLNFSDPWPKARHAKRRLTYHKRLENYKKILGAGGFIEFKTDNDALFEFTLGEIELQGYKIQELTRDLHGVSAGTEHTEDERVDVDNACGGGQLAGSERARTDSANFMTEYEQKFAAQGKNINYVRF